MADEKDDKKGDDKKKPSRADRRKKVYDHATSKKARGDSGEPTGKDENPPNPAAESNSLAPARPNPGGEAEEPGGTKNGAMDPGHVTEHKDMHTRHEKERRDLHGANRDEHRSMHARHLKELGEAQDRVAAHRRHEGEHVEMAGRHHKALADLHGKHHEERRDMHARHEKVDQPVDAAKKKAA